MPVNSLTKNVMKTFEKWLVHRQEYARNLNGNEQKILERFSSKNIAQQYVSCWESAMDQYKRKIA